MADYDYLAASNGSGDAALMHIEEDRLPGSNTIKVDSVVNVSAKFIGTYGTVDSNGLITSDTKRDFKGHLSGADLVIDEFAPGSADDGNTQGQVVIIKPNTHWSNQVASFIQNATGNGTPEALTADSLSANSLVIAGQTITSLIPTGSVISFAGATAPDGWLLAAGQEVSRTTYASLYSVIGAAYGQGDGSSTFNLPNLKGSVVVGLDAADTDFSTLGKTGGEKTHKLTVSEMPSHSHSGTTSSDTHTHTANRDIAYTDQSSRQTNSSGGNQSYGYGDRSFLNSDTHNHTFSTNSQGGNAYHNILQPYVTTNYIIKY